MTEKTKEALISKISDIYKKSWAEYDQSMLIEQLKELENPPKNTKNLSFNEILDLLIQDDIRELSKKSLLELESEFKNQSMY